MFFFWNELLTESDRSSSEEEDGLRARVPRPRVRNFMEEVVDFLTDVEFRENFRMDRVTFNHILSLIIDRISTNIIDKGQHTITPRVQLCLALWYFGTPDSYRSICGRFNVGKATALRTVRRVAEVLLYISPNFILWPTNDYLEEVKNGFQRMGFPNTIGAIDGTHIKIPKPKNHGNSYVNRKSYPSIILQAVCDNTLKLTHCYAGEVGAHHDASVLRRSEIWSFMTEDGKFPNDSHLIGDKTYPFSRNNDSL
nr:protein ANTAGONIST OF LIKE HETEROCHROMATIN PROTEIN 1-like isoform X2 [Leptinotarsa decemlineata]